MVENVHNLLTGLRQRQLIKPLHSSLMANIDTAEAARFLSIDVSTAARRSAGNIRVDNVGAPHLRIIRW